MKTTYLLRATPNPSLKLSPNGVAHWACGVGASPQFCAAVPARHTAGATLARTLGVIGNNLPGRPVQMPEITSRVAGWQDKPVLSRLLELYQYDMCEFLPKELNLHGEYGFAVDRYLCNPTLRAYFLLVNGNYAGFGMVDSDVRLPGNEFWMGQFFVMKQYRRSGVATKAVHFIFDQFRGRWEVGQMPLNKPAQAFWRRTIDDYTGGAFVEHELHDEKWDGFIQCFNNSNQSK
jgi:predicted acetyltransferase